MPWFPARHCAVRCRDTTGRFMDGLAGTGGSFREVSRNGKMCERIAKPQKGEIGTLL